MQAPLFTEQQHMRQWWLQLVLAVPAILVIWALVQQLVFGVNFGNNPMSDMSLFLMAALVFGLSGLLWTANLKTEYTAKHLQYRFFPFHWKDQHLNWSEVKQATLLRYRPIKDYGGWGLRYSVKNGKAFNVSGSLGLRIETKGGKKILFGTQDPEAIRKVFKELKLSLKDELKK
ncbi:MAG: hypothetical protein AAF798_14390 [Bacteroidota bacterium]